MAQIKVKHQTTGDTPSADKLNIYPKSDDKIYTKDSSGTEKAVEYEGHDIASHGDTTATGAELDTLTDGSNADALHTHADGSERLFVTISTDTTLVDGTNRNIQVDTSGGDVTLTLPLSSVGTGTYDVWKTTGDKNDVIIVRAGSDTIVGETSFLWRRQHSHFEFVPDGGSKWIVK